MQPAANLTVLGNFNDVSLSNYGITSTFFRRDSKFMVRTDGPDGALHDYEIKFVFGVYPLQQYLVMMPGGRLQALGMAWDTRSPQRGGQRWFSLYPGEKITHHDSRHWTGIDRTWNYMCADCHSTNVRKNYDLRTRTYATTYAAINVACEACHGPGSNHVSWARKESGWQKYERGHGLTIALDEREGVSWSADSNSDNIRRSKPRKSEREIEMCARCHSRRSQIHEDYVHGQPMGDDYRVALLEQDLYFPDGQIKGEDYEYGSFLQSRMFHAGVTCSDCHEPHNLKLRAEGNNVCLQCHSVKYDSAKHHFHPVGSRGSRCIECHMPARTYMIVDPRRDHSIRIPRPDLPTRLGIPNACTNCHVGKSAQWASDAVDKWYGRTPVGFQHFAEALHSAAEGAPGARQSLMDLIADHEQPAVARATALSMLANYALPPSDTAVRAEVKDDSSLVRRAAARALSNSDPAIAATFLAPLLNDPVRAVRMETAETLAGVPANTLPPKDARFFSSAINEYVAAQELNADRPEAHMNLGLLDAKENHFGKAEAEFTAALSLDRSFTPAAVDLADLYREQNQDQVGERILEDAISRSPNDASLRYALGLLMVRQGQRTRALGLLATAAHIDADNARYAYVYAIALNDAGQASDAIDVLKTCIRTHPFDRDSLAALVSLLERAGYPGQALPYARRFSELEPANDRPRPTLETQKDQPHH